MAQVSVKSCACLVAFFLVMYLRAIVAAFTIALASAGMLALRREGTVIKHEDFVEGIQAVQMKKKDSLQYFA